MDKGHLQVKHGGHSSPVQQLAYPLALPTALTHLQADPEQILPRRPERIRQLSEVTASDPGPGDT